MENFENDTLRDSAVARVFRDAFLDIAKMIATAPPLPHTLGQPTIVRMLAEDPVCRNLERLLRARFQTCHPFDEDLVATHAIERVFAIGVLGAEMLWTPIDDDTCLVEQIVHNNGRFEVDGLFFLADDDEARMETFCAHAQKPFSEAAYDNMLRALGVPLEAPSNSIEM